MVNDTGTTTTGAWDALAPGRDARDLAAMLRRFFADQFGPEQMRQSMDDDRPSAWPSIVELGLPAIGVPASAGGDGTLLDGVIMLEEAGRALLAEPLLTGAMAHLTAAAAGLHDPAWLLEQAAFGIAPATDTAALAVDVLDARDTSRLVLVLPSLGGIRVQVIEPDDVADLALDRATHLDPTRAWSQLRLAADDLPGRGVLTGLTLDRLLAPARLAVAADLVGVAAAALDSATAHVLQRQQFGQPLGAFQAVKHALADAYVLVERARSLTWGGAVAATGASDHDTVDLARLAKAAAADAAVAVSRLHTQLLGALGMTYEADSHLFVRRAMQTAPALGSAATLYAAVAHDRHDRNRRA